MKYHRAIPTILKRVALVVGLFMLVVILGAERAYSQSCDAGTFLVKFEWEEGAFVPEGGNSYGITISNVQHKPDEANEPISFDFSSSSWIGAVVIKAAGDTKKEVFNPAVTSGSVDISGLGYHAISNVQFCQGTPPPEEFDLQCNLPPSSPDIGPLLEADKASPLPGENVTFTGTFRNDGAATATGVQVTVTYPEDNFDFVSASGASFAPANPSSGTFTFNLGSLAAGEEETLVFTLKATAQGGASVAAFVSSVTTDNDPDSDPSASYDNEDDGCVAIFNVLPVELVSFDARVNGDIAHLSWLTASETSNAGFEVQHRYLDGSNKSAAAFEVLDFVAGHGTTLEAQSYSFRVDDLQPGRHVFRLKQIDYDGTFDYSPQVEVAIEMPDAFLVSEVYPNPFNPQASFSFSVRQEQQVRVALYDVLGRQVKILFQGRPAASTTQTLTIDGTGLPSGMYLLQVVGEQFVDTQRVTLLK